MRKRPAAYFPSSDPVPANSGGVTWGAPGLVTGNGQQSASFVQLSDGSLVLAFGHKDAGEGQKFILSYDGKMRFLYSFRARVSLA